MSDERTYIGTFTRPDPLRFGLRAPTFTRSRILESLTPEQQNWISKFAPDFEFWRDEFRRMNYHLYVKRKLTVNQLALANMLFTNAEPSHLPMGEESLWKNSNIP